MNIDLEEFKHLADFDNILVVDESGKTLFYDLADINILSELGHRPEDFLGKHVTSFYQNLTNENSTIMTALKTGSALCNIEQEMITRKGSTFISKSSTFPIRENDKIIGAIEFSKHYFTKDSMKYLDHYVGHKIYRKNNTVYTINDMITVDEKMVAIKSKMEKIAKTDSTVFIYGRTGTGKEVVAQSIHNLSERYGNPFISVNCGAIPANLLESTLFGTTKGSFTGAEDMPGLFEQAEGGTLFLDEINSLDTNLQVKLLKAIEEKTIRRIGGKKNIQLNMRVISATNEDPDVLLVEKRMRQDLYYRLSVVQIDLPSLVERKDDIAVLLRHFILFYNQNMNIFIEKVQQEVIDSFQLYPWPGNIRELKNAIETAFVHASSNEITIDDIPARIRKYKTEETETKVMERLPLKEAVSEYEKELIVRKLEETNGIIAETARKLGISKQLLKYKMDKFGLR